MRDKEMVRRFGVGNGEWGSVVFDQLKALAVGDKTIVLAVQPETVDESCFETCLGRMRWRQVRAGVKESRAEPGEGGRQAASRISPGTCCRSSYESRVRAIKL